MRRARCTSPCSADDNNACSAPFPGSCHGVAEPPVCRAPGTPDAAASRLIGAVGTFCCSYVRGGVLFLRPTLTAREYGDAFLYTGKLYYPDCNFEPCVS